MRPEPTVRSMLTLLFLLTLLPFPLAAQDGCYTCDPETKNCKEAAKLGFEDCVDGTKCGPAGCLDICIAGPIKCAEIVPIDPPELRTRQSLLACGHGHPPAVAPLHTDALVTCQTPNGAPVGSCLRGLG